MYGRQEGLALKVEVVQERDLLEAQLALRAITINEMRRQIANLTLGEKIDQQATEEVRLTVEELQNSIAELNEEIRFYKGVMLPNVEQQGLRAFIGNNQRAFELAGIGSVYAEVCRKFHRTAHAFWHVNK